MNNIEQSINRNLASIETKLDSMIVTLAARHPTDNQLTERLENAEARFTAALAVLVSVQSQFIGKSGEVVYFSIEAARNEIKAAYQILTAGTIYDGGLENI